MSRALLEKRYNNMSASQVIIMITAVDLISSVAVVLLIPLLLLASPLAPMTSNAQLPGSTLNPSLPSSSSSSNIPSAQTNQSSTLTNTTIFNLSNNPGFSFLPRIALSQNNRDVYVVWADNSTGNGDILFKRSTDGGATFDNTVNLSNNTAFSFFPRIAISESPNGGNNVYVVWADNSTGNGDILFKRSTDGGATFDNTVNLSNNDNSSINPQIAAVASGSSGGGGDNIYVVWQDNTSLGPLGAGGSNSSSSAASSGAATTITTTSSIVLKRSTDGGATFDNTVNLSNRAGAVPVNPQIAVAVSPRTGAGGGGGAGGAGGDDVYVVWQDNSSGGSEEIIFWKGVVITQQQQLAQPQPQPQPSNPPQQQPQQPQGPTTICDPTVQNCGVP